MADRTCKNDFVVGLAELMGLIGATSASTGREKSRAYDFVLPFKTAGWKPSLFVQSQFYAGDSGSVSHKNVDQTSTSSLGSQADPGGKVLGVR